jgi:hypothetical protein
MASQVSPGVVIKERDISNAVIVGSQAIRAAFTSTFRTGPVGKIVNIDSERELIDIFGTPEEGNANDWLVGAEFLRYGGQLAVIRASTGVTNATKSGAGVLVADKTSFDSGVTTEKFLSRYAGTEGNSFQVVVVDHGADYKVTKAAHGLAVGATYTAGNATTHEVYKVINTSTFLIVKGTGAVPTAGSGETVTAYTNSDWNAEAIGSTTLTYKAIGPRPATSPWAAERYLSNDELHFAVVDLRTNTIIERFTYLSKIVDAKSPEGSSTYWRSAINEFSNKVYAGQDFTSAEFTALGENPGALAASYSATASSPKEISRILTTAAGTLSGGTDDYLYTAGEIGAAYDEFLDTEATTIDFVLMGGSMNNETDTLAKALRAVAVANSRKDCIAFISPFTGNQIASSGGVAIIPSTQLSNTVNFFSSIPSSSYVVLDSGIKYTYDRFNDKYRYIGCNGDAAGLCVATSANLDDWFSPAGVNRGGIQNVVKLAFNPNKAQRDDLYSNRINPIVSLAGTGPVLFGDKTALASPSAFDRINVRRLFLNVESRVKGLAEGVLFEQNDSTTRSNFTASITSYLSEVQARRGVIDFLVVCDETNNTPEVIDRNEFVAELYLKPTRSINFVTVTVTATKTGVSFSEVVGR